MTETVPSLTHALPYIFTGDENGTVFVDTPDKKEKYHNASEGAVILIESQAGDKALVYADYRDNGTWTMALSRYDKGHGIPHWINYVESSNEDPDSSILVILAPDGTQVSRVR